MRKSVWPAVALSLVLSLALAACGAGDPGTATVSMVPEADLPAEVAAAPANVKEAYRFAVANPELLHEIPCFCGCVASGHTSNYSCYVVEDADSGPAVQFDNHALGCGICVDITQDVMAMSQEGKSVAEMRNIIDARYGSFGPSTDAGAHQLMSQLPEN